MKKLFKVISVVLIIALGIYTYDLYSGYSLTKKVDSLLASSENVQESAYAENTEDEPGLMYSRLNDEEKEIYNTLYNGVNRYKENIFIRSMPESETVFKVFRLMLSEHPEIFWTKGDSTYSTAGILKPKYLYPKDEAVERMFLIEDRVSEILSGASGSEYEKAVYFFDYIVTHTEYDDDNAVDGIDIEPRDSTIEGVFLENKAICAGYAKAYQYLLNRAGMQAIYVTGDAVTPEGESKHAWVYQKVNGEYCFSDPTWGDSYEKGVNGDFASHIFFCRTGDSFSSTHKTDTIYGELNYSQEDLSYFRENSLYFDSYDVSGIRKAVKTSITNNDPAIELEFADDKVYEKSKTELIDNGGIYFILKSVDPFSSIVKTDEISFNCNDTHKVIMFAYKEP